jgi:cation diffusion facilitator CzcD-associated flavoprotein CzcO
MIMGAADSGQHDVDLLIVGAGPCGLAAAISAQRAGLHGLARHYLQERLAQKPGGAWGARLAAGCVVEAMTRD